MLAPLVAIVVSAVTTPFPGMKVVRQPSSAMVIANLCQAGVSVRATKYAERNATPQGWATAVGAQAAVNGDFFDFPGWTLVVGRARGAGEDWPADKQFLEARSYWQFGPNLAELVGDANVLPLATSAATDIVGGHNTLILDGVSRGPLFDGDGAITTAHRRTAIGLSKDRRTLFLFATDKILDGSGIVAELLALQSEAGGPTIDVATNQDGGGSSQLFVQGLGQIITSGRPVNNHLGIYARGSGPAPNCNNVPPRGTLDGASCTGVAGWAQDVNAPTAAIDAHVYFNGPAGSPAATGIPLHADASRPDLCAPLGSCEHAFSMPLPRALLDGQPHEVHAYGIDSEGGPNPELAASPRTVTCAGSLPVGVRRHVRDDAAFAAWRFSLFLDVQKISAPQLDSYVTDSEVPVAPELVKDPAQPAVWLVDRGYRRWVMSRPVAAAWHLDLTLARAVTAAEVDAMPQGPPLRAQPELVQGPGPAVYLIDDLMPEPARKTRAQAPASRLAVNASEDPGTPGPAKQGDLLGGCSSAPGLLAGLGLLLLRRGRRTA